MLLSLTSPSVCKQLKSTKIDNHCTFRSPNSGVFCMCNTSLVPRPHALGGSGHETSVILASHIHEGKKAVTKTRKEKKVGMR